jgi:ribosomal protein S18 acetylase RimI-like enzyme
MSPGGSRRRRTRPLTVDDGPLVAELLNQQHRQLHGRDVADADDITAWLTMPRGNLPRDSRLLLDDSGTPIASVIVEGRANSNLVKVFLALGETVDRRGLANDLLAVVDEHAQVSAIAAGLAQPEVEIQEIPTGDDDLESALRERGYRQSRRSVELHRDLADLADLADLPQPELPPGTRLVQLDLDAPAHVDALAQIEREAFEDHDGDMVMERDELEHLLRSDPKYLPDLQLLVLEAASAVAMCLASTMPNEPVPTGYVSSLGVRRAWRGRGIGRALLLTQFRAFQHHGWRAAKLHVQVGNRTGADRLYSSLGMSELLGFAAWTGSLRGR